MSKIAALRPLLIGSEIEYTLSGSLGMRRICPEQVQIQLLREARRTLTCLPAKVDHASGYFLANGARFYAEVNGILEYATGECSTPEEVVCHNLAGEQILVQLSQQTHAHHAGDADDPLQFAIARSNLCPVDPDRVSNGNHESYTCWLDLQSAAASLLPFLVTRLPFAGAGCLSAAAESMGFELSQRARHLTQPVGSKTTHHRAIFCNRTRYARDYSRDGWTRVNLISKDSARCPLSDYVTFGTTGLLFWILNQGGRIGRRLSLSDPVAAIRLVSQDPSLEVRLELTDGRKVSALEIQRVYLDDAEEYLARSQGPAWASRVLTIWREVLSALADNPLSLAGKLDAYTKLWLYHHELARAKASWTDLRMGLQLLRSLRKAYDPEVLEAVLADDPDKLSVERRKQFPDAMQRVLQTGPGGYERLHLAVRFSALDFEYHKLGGFFDRLVQSGLIENTIASTESVARATTEPPATTRAHARGQLIQQFARERGWEASWDHLVHSTTGKTYSLTDPFLPAASQATDPLGVSW